MNDLKFGNTKIMPIYDPRSRQVSDLNIVISTQGENVKQHQTEILALFKTLRQFGGQISSCKLIANFVGSVDYSAAMNLKQLDVKVNIIKTFDSRSPHSNKIKSLDLEFTPDILFVLDCDTVIACDFFQQINPQFFQAKPVDQDPLSIEQWNRLFAHFGLKTSTQRYQTSFHAKPTIAYFNSGVLSIPGKYIRKLRESWSYYVTQLFDVYDRFPDIGAHRFFTDQFALALALQHLKIPTQIFSLEMNFPTHHPVHDSFVPHNINPYILHHHHRVDCKGQLLPTGYDEPDKAINKINRFLISASLE